MKNPYQIHITPEGYKTLEEEFTQLTQKRPGVLTRMVAAREQGDLSENAGYHAAKDELGRIDGRLRELKQMLKHAKIAQANNSETVSMGKKVILKSDGEQIEYFIVSAMEADPSKGKISDVSPIGKALVGKKAGETIEIEIPDGKIIFQVVEVKA